MKKETYEKQKVFAGKLKPSMFRRCVGHDYMERSIYMVTMTVEGRYSLFGHVEGRSDAPFGSTDAPRMTLNELGKRVEKHFYEIETRYPQIEVLAVQMMPDHLHGILFVKEHLPRPLGQVIAGFKSGCNKDYREIIRGERGEPSVPPSISPSVSPSISSSVPSVVALPQQTKPSQEKPQRPPRSAYNRTHGLLFSAGFNDRVLLQEGQLKRWIHYLYDNPRRLLMKREHPDLFRVQRNLRIGQYTFSAIGNRLLLSRPIRLQVKCSRSLSEEEVSQRVTFFLHEAEKGAVLVSPSISKGEKAVMRAVFEQGFPVVILQENGFSDLAKPSGKCMEACAEGKLLLLAPWTQHQDKRLISRGQCLSLNEMAHLICESDIDVFTYSIKS
jgi:hypothetical protein